MISHLEKKIGYTFQEESLLVRALTHASKSPEHLERQEFLGDSVLGLTITEYLYKHYPQSAEGDLSKMRANLVCKSALLDIAEQWKLEGFLNVGAGERNSDGSIKSESILANAVESLIGAVFEDAGWEKARNVVLYSWHDKLDMVQPINLRDAKSALQELTQSLGLGLPTYALDDLGAHQSPRFHAVCSLNGKYLADAYGQRKKEAEIKAAKEALKSTAIQKLKAK